MQKCAGECATDTRRHRNPGNGGLAGRSADELLGSGASAGAEQDLRNATHLLASAHAAWGLGSYLSDRTGSVDPLTLVQQDPGLEQQGPQAPQEQGGQAGIHPTDAIMYVAKALRQARVLNTRDMELANEASGSSPALFEDSFLDGDMRADRR